MTDRLGPEKGRIGRAAEIWLDYLTQTDPEPLDAFLERHGDLSDLLALMAQGDPTSWIREAELASPRNGTGKVGPSLEEQLARLERHRRAVNPYESVAEIARGGMGLVSMVRDEVLRRHVAMKVIHRIDEASDGDVQPTDSVTLGRFLDEAQVTGQLDHPGVVPVHELGMDASGHAFFTMRLVKGRTLDDIFQLARGESGGWTQTRALEVILKVCDTLAYAHSKGVIHRDLKPSNVMVGRFGEVYVMDWGLAKVLGRDDPRDLRIRPATSTTQSRVRTDRSEEAASDPDSPLITMDGAVIGTPCYMPPEQAEGRIEELGPRSEVYALGAMLYTLLTGQRPYLKPGSPISPYAVLAAVAEGPPTPIHSLAPATSFELAAICEKAMARRIEQRYESMDEMAADLRAYLDRRVVRAYRTGPIAELRKWVARNKGLAVACHAALLALVAGLVTSLVFYNRERKAANRAEVSLAVAMADGLVELRRRAEEDLWPADSTGVGAMEKWLGEAQLLSEQLETCRVSHNQLDGTMETTSAAVGQLEPGSSAWRLDKLRKYIPQLELLLDGPPELPAGDAGMYGTSIPVIERRLEIARGLLERTTGSPDAAKRWQIACADIADSSGRYSGFRIEPQEGLLPLSKNPRTGLWEFWSPLSGDEPGSNPDWFWDAGEAPREGTPVEHPNRWKIDEGTGIVFVLIPATRFHMGSSAPGSGGTNVDPNASDTEFPEQAITLDAFFISKYELTQAQWLRVAGNSPSMYGPEVDYEFLDLENTLVHPVESVSRDEALACLRRLGMTLPTEAQWECAARAGSTTPWFVEKGATHLLGHANLTDRAATVEGQPWGRAAREVWPAFDDGWPAHSPVGHYRANGFGLHDVCGNVAEWCLDDYPDYDRHPWQPGDGLRTVENSKHGVLRGGDYKSLPFTARSASRFNFLSENRDSTTGLRPAIPLGR